MRNLIYAQNLIHYDLSCFVVFLSDEIHIYLQSRDIVLLNEISEYHDKLFIGGETFHPDGTIVADPFRAECEPNSRNSNPNMEKFILVLLYHCIKFFMNLINCEPLGNIPAIFHSNSSLSSKCFDNSSTWYT